MGETNPTFISHSDCTERMKVKIRSVAYETYVIHSLLVVNIAHCVDAIEKKSNTDCLSIQFEYTLSDSTCYW